MELYSNATVGTTWLDVIQISRQTYSPYLQQKKCKRNEAGNGWKDSKAIKDANE